MASYQLHVAGSPTKYVVHLAGEDTLGKLQEHWKAGEVIQAEATVMSGQPRRVLLNLDHVHAIETISP